MQGNSLDDAAHTIFSSKLPVKSDAITTSQGTVATVTEPAIGENITSSSERHIQVAVISNAENDVESSPVVDRMLNFCDSSNQNSSIFEDAERQWERYKTAFRSSDIDRLMMEETAKVCQYHAGRRLS